MIQNNSLLKPSSININLKAHFMVVPKMAEKKNNGIFGTFTEGRRIHCSNVYGHHRNLGTHCSDSACSEPFPSLNLLLGYIGPCLYNCGVHFLITSWRVSTTPKQPISNVPRVFYTIKVQSPGWPVNSVDKFLFKVVLTT